jgi:predicted permease
LLTESLIMALLAAGVGIAFARGSMELLKSFAAQLTPRAREISIDGWVLVFAITCAAATTIVCGTLAAMHTRTEVANGLREHGTGSASLAGRGLLRSVLIAAQVAFSYVLLIGAGLMVNSLIHLQRVDPGYVEQRAFIVNFGLNFTKYPPAEWRAAARRLLQRVQEIPGTAGVAVASSYPMSSTAPGTGSGPGRRFRVLGDSRPDTELPAIQVQRRVTPDYFRALGVPLIAGRFFRDSDGPESTQVLIINRELARRAWPRTDPVGQRVTFDGEHYLEVVGVVGDVREFGPALDVPVQVYQPMEQNPFPGSVVVRAVGDSGSVLAAARRAVLEANPEAAITRVDTLEDVRAEAIRSPRTIARLFGLFGLLALVIAVAGIGSMLALWVRQRMREIGIRIALGASPGDILGTVVKQGMVLAIAGAAAGLAGSLALARLIAKLLFQVTPTDLPTYVAVSAVLLVSALLACWLPALRAARIDPQVALRTE